MHVYITYIIYYIYTIRIETQENEDHGQEKTTRQMSDIVDVCAGEQKEGEKT